MKLRLAIYNGYLSFVPASIEDEMGQRLREWVENMGPEDLMYGEWTFEIDVAVEEWTEDGPTFVPADGGRR